jgi:cellulose synthase/poly-beta-1,6-N-acetylglucosamine synthase-like glycosyltransferase
MTVWRATMADRPALDASLVCTVLNEAGNVDDLMRSIAAQTVRPREVIVVDGGSRDGTQLHIEWWHGRLGCPLRVIERAGANIATGRNIGIAAARAPIIAVTDAGVRLDAHWLERLCAPFADPGVSLCGGFFLPDSHTPFETAMGATVLPARDDIAPATFLPSSRSIAFRKAVWSAVGGYPEWLDYGEDLVFDLAVRACGCRTAFAADAVVWFRPRRTLRAFWHQYFRYARGDGKADLWRRRHAVRYVTYTSLVVLITLGKRGRWLWPVALAGSGIYLRRPYQRLSAALPPLSPAHRLTAIIAVPIIRGVGDMAKMCGYPVGVLWRIRHHGLRWNWRDAIPAHSEAHEEIP